MLNAYIPLDTSTENRSVLIGLAPNGKWHPATARLVVTVASIDGLTVSVADQNGSAEVRPNSARIRRHHPAHARSKNWGE